jgi:hypothetical protein
MPALAVINLGSGVDVGQVQRVLDRVAADLQTTGKHRHRSPTRQELVVRGDVAAIQELRRRLEVASVKEWTRRTDIEARSRKTVPQRTSVYCFSKQVPAIGRQAAVLLRGRGPGDGEELYVSSVVPLAGREPLSLEQHDEVVSDFRNTLLKPLVRDLSIRILYYDVNTKLSLEEILSPEALARLRAFSMVANKGNLHSLDMRRWAEFIGQTHLDDTVIGRELLAAWLDDEDFSQDQHNRLIDEFESGRQLLNVYDEERREKCPE